MKYTPGRKNIIDSVFDSYFDDIITKNKMGNKDKGNHTILESDKGYILEIAAPGFLKEDFEINTDKNVLTISAEKKYEIPEGYKVLGSTNIEKEISQTFKLSDEVDKEKISGTYEHGILSLTLPKKEKKDTSRKIEIE